MGFVVIDDQRPAFVHIQFDEAKLPQAGKGCGDGSGGIEGDFFADSKPGKEREVFRGQDDGFKADLLGSPPFREMALRI